MSFNFALLARRVLVLDYHVALHVGFAGGFEFTTVALVLSAFETFVDSTCVISKSIARPNDPTTSGTLETSFFSSAFPWSILSMLGHYVTRQVLRPR